MARLSPNVEKVMRIVHKLKKTEVARFSGKELRDDFEISLQKLDFVTGAPCTGGEAYITPIAPERIIEWLEKYAPEEEEERASFEIDFPDLDVTEVNPAFEFGEGLQLCKLLLNRVRFTKDENMGVMMGKESHWNAAALPQGLMNWCRLPDSDWEAKEPFHQVHPSEYNLDFDCVTRPHPELPHMQCWLVDELPINNGPSLSPAELITTLTLAVSKIQTKEYRRASDIPITVFSCCGRKLRIVQGAINFRNLDLDFRYSDVVDFSVGGVRSNSPNAKTVAQVLGWVLGQPVGQIFPDKSQ